MEDAAVAAPTVSTVDGRPEMSAREGDVDAAPPAMLMLASSVGISVVGGGGGCFGAAARSTGDFDRTGWKGRYINGAKSDTRLIIKKRRRMPMMSTCASDSIGGCFSCTQRLKLKPRREKERHEHTGGALHGTAYGAVKQMNPPLRGCQQDKEQKGALQSC